MSGLPVPPPSTLTPQRWKGPRCPGSQRPLLELGGTQAVRLPAPLPHLPVNFNPPSAGKNSGVRAPTLHCSPPQGWENPGVLPRLT